MEPPESDVETSISALGYQIRPSCTVEIRLRMRFESCE